MFGRKEGLFPIMKVDDEGHVDFNNDFHTTNGRGTFELNSIPHGNVRDIPPLRMILILNRNFDILPAIVKLNHEQAAAYFMLGETTGTSAGGISETGKALRIPGTNPFFPMDHASQGNRFINLLDNSPKVDVYLLNTGYIGGEENSKFSKKVTIDHSKKLIESLLKNELIWENDDDFGYQIVTSNSSPIDTTYTNPKELYRRSGRIAEYEEIKTKLILARKDFLSGFENLNKKIIQAI